MDLNFGFPFEPYPQQLKLMSAIEECIESSSSGCFESPTGTGKSLSAICSTLHWLIKEEEKVLSLVHTTVETEDSKPVFADDDWLSELLAQPTNVANKTIEKKGKEQHEAKDRFDKMKQRVISMRRGAAGVTTTQHHSSSKTQQKPFNPQHSNNSIEDDEFLLKHYDSSEEKGSTKSRTSLLEESSDDEDEARDPDDFAALHLPQIYYCSRTHSQISQFVSEIKKTCYSQVRCVVLGSRRNLCVNRDVMSLRSESAISERCLEMHKNKAKTPITSDAPSSSTQKSTDNASKKKRSTKATESCQFHNRHAESALADYGLSQVRDLEALMTAAETAGNAPVSAMSGMFTTASSSVNSNNNSHKSPLTQAACPYYASRRAIRRAQIVCMPYNLLLQKELRDSVGLSLENKVVVIDEAHNLIETINAIHSAFVTASHLSISLEAVGMYLKRYQTVLSGRNVYYLKVLEAVVKKIRNKCLSICKQANSTTNSTHSTNSTASTGLAFSVNDFIFGAGFDNINLLKLSKYVAETNLTEKISGYHASVRAAEAAKVIAINTTNSSSGGNDRGDSFNQALSAIRNVVSLLRCLTNMDVDGRVVVKSIPAAISAASVTVPAAVDFSLNYLMLNPATHFAPIVQQARSVVLLGGTLQPYDHLVATLFPPAPVNGNTTITTTSSNNSSSSQNIATNNSLPPPPRLRLFSCGHVVDPSHVKAMVVTRGPSGAELQFTSDRRLSVEVVDSLHGVLLQLCRCVPGGVVVFFTSYAYMESVLARWRCNNGHLLNQLHAVKPVFVEKSSKGGNIGNEGGKESAASDSVWEAYSRQIRLSSSSANTSSTTNPHKGGMLFSVIGGTLSEGINFSDDLARCVVVVGMPYPDHRDVVFQQKMQFNAERVKTTMAGGNSLLDTLCMKAVNQSIGRSIRHAGDFASIVLLDKRYAQERIRAQLPGWIRQGVECSGGAFGATDCEGLQEFYRQRRK